MLSVVVLPDTNKEADMAGRRKAGPGKAKRKANSRPRSVANGNVREDKEPREEKIIEMLSSQFGRASAEDIAEELTKAFGGAKGFALLMQEIVYSSSTKPTTKARIVQQVMTYIERASKHYGDINRLASMDKDEIEKKITLLLKKHNNVVPIPGVKLDVTERKLQVEEASAVDQPDAGNSSPAWDMDARRLPDVRSDADGVAEAGAGDDQALHPVPESDPVPPV